MFINTDTTRDESPYIDAHAPGGRPLRIERDRTPQKHPSDVFTDLIQRKPQYCNNCFNRRFSYFAYDFHCGVLGWLEYKRRYPVPKRNSPDPLREQRQGGQKLCCAECGHHTGKDRTLTVNEATDHAGRISKALRRQGVAHDRETLLREARRRAHDPDTSGAEDERLFSPAVAEAIRASQ